MKKLISLVLLVILLTFNQSFAYTNISGGIYNNTTWTLAGSPYLMTGSVVVFPGKTLTIEPGVEIYVVADSSFNTGNFKYLEIRGQLIANGTASQPIRFVSTDTSIGFYNWEGIKIKGSQGGSVQMNHFELGNSYNGISNEISQPGVTYNFDGCIFKSNNYGIQLNADLVLNNCTATDNGVVVAAQYFYGSLTATNCTFANNFCSATNLFIPGLGSSGSVNLTNCTFSKNTNNLISVSGQIKNCLFDSNYYGLVDASDVTIDSCTFIGNDFGVNNLNNSTIKNSNFNNNVVAINIASNCIVKNNDIQFNSNGIQISGFIPTSGSIMDNKICSNNIYNLENLTDRNFSVAANCFCTTDSTQIEMKLYDGYDDITRGLVNYAIYDDSCVNVVTYVMKVDLGDPTSVDNITKNQIKAAFQNNNLFVESPNYQSFVVYDLNSKKILEGNLKVGANNFEMSVAPGLYILRTGTTVQKIMKTN